MSHWQPGVPSAHNQSVFDDAAMNYGVPSQNNGASDGLSGGRPAHAAGQGAANGVQTQFVPIPIMQNSNNSNGQQSGARSQQLNNLFKTQLCKHFQQNKHCSKGNGCHFAHGEAELRRKDEQLPMEVQFKMLNIPYNNYKTQICKYFEQNKQCSFDKNCTYAHGIEELRKPYEELPQDTMPGLEVTNPNAFRLLSAQIQAHHAKFQLNDPQNSEIKSRVMEISQLFRQNQDDRGYQLLRTLLQNNQISATYAFKPTVPVGQQPGGQPQQQQPGVTVTAQDAFPPRVAQGGVQGQSAMPGQGNFMAPPSQQQLSAMFSGNAPMHGGPPTGADGGFASAAGQPPMQGGAPPAGYPGMQQNPFGPVGQVFNGQEFGLGPGGLGQYFGGNPGQGAPAAQGGAPAMGGPFGFYTPLMEEKSAADTVQWK